MRAAAIGLILTLALATGAFAIDYRSLAETYSPIWYVDTDDGRTKSDYITAYDFDGDRRTDNNWESLESGDLLAVTYYSVIETETHYFIHYFIYWPQDWFWWPDSDVVSHENDMEGALVVVTKVEDEPGELLLVETSAELNIFSWSSHPYVDDGDEDLAGGVKTFDTHPRIYACSQSHHVVLDDVWVVFGSYVGDSGDDFPGDDGVVYFYRGAAEQPSTYNDRDVGYDLVSILDDLWPEALGPFGTGTMLDCPVRYIGHRFTVGDYLGMCFDGDTFEDDAGKSPWGLDDENDALEVGDWFLDPADTVYTHLTIQGEFSRYYVYNPYLASIAPRIVSTAATQAWLDTPYHYDEDDTAQAEGNQPLFWEKVAGPNDLEIDESNGRVEWTPDSPGDFTITIRALSPAGRDDQSFTVNVSTDDPPVGDDDDPSGDDDDSRDRSTEDEAGCCG
ncbi:MAG: hypothetical protein P9M14_02115 [Candidatus Alcyoniella australis]|nr:hypothetical protein [Candidatus Alcyoniella australis]